MKKKKLNKEKITRVLVYVLCFALVGISLFSLFSVFVGASDSSEVTDLTNTTWYLNDTLSLTEPYFNFAINFKANDVSYTALKTGIDSVEMSATSLYYNNVEAYNGLTNIWQKSNIITITGGTDVTNPSLIQWLETNGTQLKVTDLTDTTWNVPAGWEAEAGYGTFQIDGVYDNNEFASFYIGIGIAGRVPVETPLDDSILIYSSTGEAILLSSNNSFTVTFTDDTDATIPKLIAWLSQYGELQEEETTSPECTHQYVNGNCIYCGLACQSCETGLMQSYSYTNFNGTNQHVIYRTCDECGLETNEGLEDCNFNLQNVCMDCGHTKTDSSTSCTFHNFFGGECTVCGYKCPHSDYQNSVCSVCGITCIHSNIEMYYNKTSAYSHQHILAPYCADCDVGLVTDHLDCAKAEVCSYDENGVCTKCNVSCIHENGFESGKCTICNYVCGHSFESADHCKYCGYTCEHDNHYTIDIVDDFECGVETRCELCDILIKSIVQPHSFVNNSHECSRCLYVCYHKYSAGICIYCDWSCVHSYIGGSIKCSNCGFYFDYEGYDDKDGFLSLFTAIYDAQANTFFKMLGYEILGVNVAGLIVSVIALAVVIWLLKKVL